MDNDMKKIAELPKFKNDKKVKKAVTFEVDDDLFDALKSYCKQNKTSQRNVINHGLKLFFVQNNPALAKKLGFI